MKTNSLWYLLLLVTIISCRKEQLPDQVFDSPYDQNSGKEIITIDTFYLSSDQQNLYIFFNSDSIFVHAVAVADSLVIFRDGDLYKQDLPRDHFTDLNISPHVTYMYNFAFRDSTGALTKISEPLEVEIP